MAFVIADRVRETSTSTGTGNFTLGGAVTGYQTFASALSTADTTYYTIADQGGANWEVGIGTFTSPSTLARTTILSSSNGGSVVTFTSGTKDVFISLPASKTNVEDQPNLIEVNSSSDALRITQTGAGNALVVEDSANPDATPFVINQSGTVIVGHTDVGATLYDVQSLTGDGASYLAQRYVSGTGGSFIRLDKSRSATIGTNTIVASGDTLGTVEFRGADGASFVPAAQIVAAVDGTPGTNDMPGRLVFNTTADGASSVTERMRIDSSGNVGIGTTAPGARLNVVNSSGDDAVRITHTGVTGNSFVVEDSANPDASPYVIDAAGRVISGYTSVITGVGTTVPRVQQAGTSANDTFYMTSRWDNTANAGGFDFAKSRGGSVNSNAVVVSGDTLGQVRFIGDDGAAFIVAASISAAVDGTPGTNDMPGRLVFSTTADGASSATERMRITNGGNVGIGTSSPGSALDVKGTLRLSGATSGYVGLAPAAAAGSTTYTLPAADGSSGQVLSTNGTGTLSWASATSAKAADVQTFNSSGTWTKPSGFGANARAYIQGWAGGGGGGKGGIYGGAGGGGGGYSERWIALSSLGATETVTIGAGGAGGTGTAAGSTGGTTTFGSFVTAYGGAGGGGQTAPDGGGGGGAFSSGSGSSPGAPAYAASEISLGGAQGAPASAGGSGEFTGGGGGGGRNNSTAGANTTGTGGNSIYGGAGGGGAGVGASAASAGGSSVNGGAGGAGSSNGTATAGSQPGGGGGATNSGTAAAGGAGRVIITVFDGA